MAERVFDKQEEGTFSRIPFSPCLVPHRSLSGDKVIFSLRSNRADEVFLVGSFNGWNEVNRMQKISDDLWQIGLPSDEICDGDTYKFKLKVNGSEVYLTDPCALENEGEPHFNSVFRELDCQACANIASKKGACRRNSPFNVFSLCADTLFGRHASYTDIARELIPYAMQMGYTHISLAGVFEDYYDHSTAQTKRALFAPRTEQGGINGFCELVSSMHRSNTGVMIDVGSEFFAESDGIDIVLFEEFAKYWLLCRGVDGIVITAESDLAATELLSACEQIQKELENATFIIQTRTEMRLISAYAFPSGRGVVSDAFADSDDNAHRWVIKAAKMSYSLMISGWGYTRAGQELGLLPEKIKIEYDERYSYQKDAMPELQLFLSDLNNLFLSEPCLRNGGCSAEENGDAITVIRSSKERSAMLVADKTGRGCDVNVPLMGDLRVAISSCSTKYGGKMSTDLRLLKSKIMLEPYETVIILCENDHSTNG